MIVYTQLDSPIGRLLLTGQRGGEKASAGGFALTGIYMQSPKHPQEAEPGWRTNDAAFDRVIKQLNEYFNGQRQQFDLPTAAQGTPFQHKVWAALCAIPYGRTWTYGELAAYIGQPTASRAVGLANGRNPLSIIVPCHRVIGANGQLTGYGGGMQRKRWLLTHEGALPASEALFA